MRRLAVKLQLAIARSAGSLRARSFPTLGLPGRRDSGHATTIQGTSSRLRSRSPSCCGYGFIAIFLRPRDSRFTPPSRHRCNHSSANSGSHGTVVIQSDGRMTTVKARESPRSTGPRCFESRRAMFIPRKAIREVKVSTVALERRVGSIRWSRFCSARRDAIRLSKRRRAC